MIRDYAGKKDTMPFTLDPEVAALMAPPGPQTEANTSERDDPITLREIGNRNLALADATAPDAPNVEREDIEVPVADGSSIPARWYTKAGSNRGSAVVYAHGGGMICGSVAVYDRFVASYVEKTGVPFLSVDYRLSPEYPGTTLVDDTHEALKWLIAHAAERGIDPQRVAIMGDSGGGGIAAGVAIAARDAGTPIAMQILIYPMLNDRTTTPDPELAAFAAWTWDNNYTGWHALLGDDIGTDEVSHYAVPARITEYRGLAPAFVDCGELDIFRDESVAWARGLWDAGVSCELHIRPGSGHGFDRLPIETAIASGAWTDRLRVLGNL